MLEINKIYCGDNLTLIKQLDDNSIDTILTDPPYGVGKSFKNDNLSDENLYKYLSNLSKEFKRVCKYNLLIDAPKNKLPLFLNAFGEWNYEYLIVLHETNGMRNGKVGFNNCGIALWFTNNKRKINRYRDVLSESIINNKKEFSHPSPKNIKHYSKLVQMFSDENDIILDPFMGSGTTAIACLQLERNFIGFELSQEYCDIADERLRKLNECK